jgi:hypothetical protein
MIVLSFTPLKDASDEDKSFAYDLNPAHSTFGTPLNRAD